MARINDFEKVLFEWLNVSDEFKSLYLIAGDFGVNPDTETIISPEVMGNDSDFLEKFIDGTGIKRYTLNISQYNVLGVENTAQNSEILNKTKALQVWCENQFENNKYPLIGYEIEEIKTTGVRISGVDQQSKISKSQFQIIIDYIDEY